MKFNDARLPCIEGAFGYLAFETRAQIRKANAGIQHKNVLELVEKHSISIESAFGHIAFETRPFETAGGMQHRRIAYLMLPITPSLW